MQKRILSLVLALALAVAAFAGCTNTNGSSASSGGAASESSGQTSETSGGEATVVRMNIGSEPDSLDPWQSAASDTEAIMHNVFEGLVLYDETGAIIPGIAENWDISEDGLTYTFHLREDAVWSNGDPVVATDFEFAWKQALNPKVAASYGYILYMLENAEAYFNYESYVMDPDAWVEANPDKEIPAEVTWEDVGVKVIDEYTLEAKLVNPLPYAGDLFAFPIMCPINEKFYNEVGADKYATEVEYFCTNGMYNITGWEHNSSITFEKHEDYWNADAVGPDKVVYKIISDSQAGLNSYLSREIDYTDLDSGETVLQAENAGFEVGVKPARSSYYLFANVNDPYLSNQNLRLALAYAVDRTALISAVYQNDNQPMTSLVPPATMGANDSSFQEALLAEKGEMYPATADLDKAKEYLDAALSELGCTVDQITLSIDCSDDALRRNCATFLQEQWRQNLGIENISVNSKQTAQVSADRNAGNYCMSLGGWSPDYNDSMTFLDLWLTGGGNNDTGWSSEEYDSLIAQAIAEPDEEARQQMLFQCEEILAEEMPIIPLYWQCQNYSYNTDKIVDGARITANQTTFWYATLAE